MCISSLPTISPRALFFGALLLGLHGGPLAVPAAAQTGPTRSAEGLYARIGLGLGDYTGDLGSSSFGDAHSHPFDLQDLVRGGSYYVS